MRFPAPIFIAALCIAHSLTMLGFSAFPTLLPQFTTLWDMSAVQAGGISSAMFLGYTLAVPLLVSLTDRVDARAIYLVSAVTGVLAHTGFALLAQGTLSAALFNALYGVSLAGTYMPGLRILGEHLPERMMARATGFYTASFAMGASGSFVLADWSAAAHGWQTMFLIAAMSAGLAFVTVLIAARPVVPHVKGGPWLAMLDPRPVLRNRSVMAYSICYGLHSYELFTLRSWLVAFLGMSMVTTGGGDRWWTPAIIAATMTLAGVFASIGGNEISIRTGRRRMISWAMVGSGLVALAAAGAATLSYTLCVVLAMAHGFAIMLDSSSLTAGAFGAAKPAERGITMAVHSTIGFGGAMIGPLVFGLLVDGFDGSAAGWSVAYGHMALVVFIGPLIMRRLNPRGAPGDRPPQ